MSGIKVLRKIQLGQETTAGTIVPATTIWRGMGTIEDTREVVFPEEDVGIIGGTDRSYIPVLSGALDFEEVEATFEQLPYILEAGIKAVGTGVADGAGSGKIYAYPLPVLSKNTIQSFTIEGGDNQQAEVMEYSFVQNFSLSGTSKEAVKMSSSWIGRQVAPATFSGGATLPEVEEIIFGKTRYYVDAVAGTIGTTEISDLVLGFSLEVNTGLIPKFTANGENYFTFPQTTKPEVLLKATYEHNSSAVSEKENWRNNIPRLIRLQISGSDLTTAGTEYTQKSVVIDLAGKYEKFNKIGEKDGNDIVDITFRARYNSIAALFASITVVNQLTSLP